MNKNKIIPIICVILILVPIFFVSAQYLTDTLRNVAGPGGLETRLVENPTFLSGAIARIINYILGLLGVIFALLIIYGGWLWMTAGGNEDQVAKGRKYLTNSIIGIIIILSAYSITWFVLREIAKSTNQYIQYYDEGEYMNSLQN